MFTEGSSTGIAPLLALGFALAVSGCGGRSDPLLPAGEQRAVDRPGLLVLGTAQDGGLPHAACTCSRCEAARADPSRERFVAGLALLVPDPRRAFLIDATPDIRPQLDRLRAVAPGDEGRVDRAPVDGVLLTHAHLGHYTGLAFFGFEAVHTRGLPVWCTPAMAGYLRDNGPWSQLVTLGNVDLREAPAGREIDVGGVTVTPIAVPHRDEYSDTVAFLFRGPRRSVLYVPDTDGWETWNPPVEELLDTVDVAIVDGTFYSLDELPGRDVTSIGHPLIVDSLERFGARVAEGRLSVLFTHLNHSNPALEPTGDARGEIERRGFEILEDGRFLPL